MAMENISPKMLALIFAGAFAILALGGWFGLVTSQRSTASSLDAQIADAQANLAVAKTAAVRPHVGAGAKGDKMQTAPVAVLATAFPSDVMMPSLLRQVQRVANDANVSLDSFTPSGITQLAGYNAIPIDLTVTGQYNAIERFVHQLRVQAGASNGHVHASGRLFAVETLGLTAGSTGLPMLSATIRIDAFVYSGITPTPTTTTTATSDSTTASAAPPAATP
jgi:Tfp pilus assembly protein PilO